MRLLVFCGRRGIERFDMLPGWNIWVPAYGRERQAQIIQHFHDEPQAALAVGPQMATGWRAPADTVILFDHSWPFPMDHAYSIQAIGRRGLTLDEIDTLDFKGKIK